MRDIIKQSALFSVLFFIPAFVFTPFIFADEGSDENPKFTHAQTSRRTTLLANKGPKVKDTDEPKTAGQTIARAQSREEEVLSIADLNPEERRAKLAAGE